MRAGVRDDFSKSPRDGQKKMQAETARQVKNWDPRTICFIYYGISRASGRHFQIRFRIKIVILLRRCEDLSSLAFENLEIP